jgi:uncharacterized MAPEG superfamily protein
MNAQVGMPTEIVLLGWAVVLLLVQLVLQTLACVGEFGLGYAFSPRDDGRVVKGLYGARLTRSFYNLLETFVVFVALALALAATGKTGGLGATGAWIWFIARVVYVPIYVLGIPVLRTLVWTVSIIGLILMLIRLFA